MGRKQGITLDVVVETAGVLADRDGLAATSLKAVADELGIQTPSLYNHVRGLPGLRRELALSAARRLAIEFAGVEGTGIIRLRGISIAFRLFAVDHPGRYASMLPAPKPGEDDELYAAMAESVAVVAEALEEAGEAPEQAIHTIRALRAMLHGFVDLEVNGGFGMPIDIDESFEAALDLVIRTIAAE